MKFLSMLVLMSMMASVAIGQTPALYNNGATLYISSDAQIRVAGDLVIQDGSQLINSGKLTIKGNLVNNAAMTEAIGGAIVFQGATTQTISGQPIFARELTISNTSGVESSVPIKVSNQVLFVEGILSNSQVADALTLMDGASINNSFLPSDMSHVNGFVVKEGVGAFNFPTGDGLRYQPIGVNLTANSLGMLAKYEQGDAGTGLFTSSGTNSSPLIARNAKEYWDLSPIGAATGSVSIFWDDYYNEGINDISDLVVAHRVNGSWQNEGGNQAVGSINRGSVSSNVLDSWSPFTLGSITSRSPLPVRIVSLEGKLQESLAHLVWTVADADGFSHFEVESSADGRRFSKVGQVKFDGSSTFRFIDPSSMWLGQIRYYRLKMVDLDYTSAFSKTIALQVDNRAEKIYSYPNPSDNIITFQLGYTPGVESVVASVVSENGKIQIQQTVAVSKGEGSLAIETLPAGAYVLSVRWESGVKHLKFVKL